MRKSVPVSSVLFTVATNRGGRNRIGRREKWPKKSWEEGEIGGKVGRREKKKRNRLGRREIYPPVPPPS